jgi:hypothetical protein
LIAWLFYPQIGELTDLARAFPETKIVLDHCGGPVGIGRFAGRRDDVFPVWKASIQEIAKCPNVVVKLGGLACACSATTFICGQSRRPRRKRLPRGAPISKPASRRSGLIDACSKATSRPTRASAAIR